MAAPLATQQETADVIDGLVELLMDTDELSTGDLIGGAHVPAEAGVLYFHVDQDEDDDTDESLRFFKVMIVPCTRDEYDNAITADDHDYD